MAGVGEAVTTIAARSIFSSCPLQIDFEEGTQLRETLHCDRAQSGAYG